MHIFPKSIFGKSILDIYFCPKQKSKKDFGEKHVSFDAETMMLWLIFYRSKKVRLRLKKY
jgi:hypothetical protein